MHNVKIQDPVVGVIYNLLRYPAAEWQFSQLKIAKRALYMRVFVWILCTRMCEVQLTLEVNSLLREPQPDI